MSETGSNPVPAPHRDRSAGLVIFGVLTILFGTICALLVPLMVISQTMTPAQVNPGGMQAIIPAALMYLGLAVILIWLGIGSIKARRWARALLVILFWGWLLVGVFSVVATALVMPPIMTSIQAMQPGGQPPLPSSAIPVMITISLVILGLVFVVIPGIGVLFYSSSHVRATCEARDPVTRWTDACPLPVLAAVLWLALMVPMILLAPLSARGVLPFFGVVLTGWPALLGYVIIAAFWAWSALAMYRLDVRGWWVLLVSFAILTLSNVVMYSQYNLVEILELMRYPEAQLAMFRKMPLFNGRAMAWGMGLFSIPFFAYLWYIKRFFP
ncbi:MAG TPA: hypothetical protein PLX89_21500 [Verrucomicrobiota bacterium]|nr:hypothetical protein [Verrucomicrobiales bacterium]HRI15580.1 hypothetical protein [Verrucomicrobiota bacterium]